MVWEPTVRVPMVNVAVPPAPRLTTPSEVEPSRNSTPPVVTGDPPEVTLAVNVTSSPNTDGLPLVVSAVAVANLSTTWSSWSELVAKLGEPPYVARIVWVPAASVDVVKEAVPLASTGTAGWSLPSTEKVTEPEVCGLPPEVTVAVKVTESPTNDGFLLDVSAVAVAALFTTWVSVPELVASSAVPPYVAVIGCDPTVRLEVVSVALPSASTGTGPPRLVPPSLNWTEPAVTGLPPAATFAVRVTLCPKVDGFGAAVTAVVVGLCEVMVRHQPLLIAPKSPVASSTTQRLQVPFGLPPFRLAMVVAVVGVGAGAGIGSVGWSTLLMFVGL